MNRLEILRASLREYLPDLFLTARRVLCQILQTLPDQFIPLRSREDDRAAVILEDGFVGCSEGEDRYVGAFAQSAVLALGTGSYTLGRYLRGHVSRYDKYDILPILPDDAHRGLNVYLPAVPGQPGTVRRRHVIVGRLADERTHFTSRVVRKISHRERLHCVGVVPQQLTEGRVGVEHALVRGVDKRDGFGGSFEKRGVSILRIPQHLLGMKPLHAHCDECRELVERANV